MPNIPKQASVGGLDVDRRQWCSVAPWLCVSPSAIGVTVKKSASKSSATMTAVLAVLSTAGFYLIAPNLPGLSTFVARYFGSEIGIVCTAMFFTGLSILFLKLIGMGAERQALRHLYEDIESGPLSTAGGDERHAALSLWSEQLAQRYQASYVHERVASTVQYIGSSGRRGVEEHLRYLAELASERLSQSYSTIRTITWAIPILGFLGTVIGITLAISDLTPEQLDSSLADVTQGLGFAFDTTALALAMSIVLVFASFATERMEQAVLNDVEQFGIEYLLPWFAAGAPEATPAASVAGLSADVWAHQLDGLRTVWTEVLQHHAAQMAGIFRAEVDDTLGLHRDSVDQARTAYAESLQATSSHLLDQVADVGEAFTRRMDAWQSALQQSSSEATRQTEAVHELSALLLRMTESEERLVSLQRQLNDNLNSLQLANTIEESANSLTAAVHVLTAKTSRRAA